MNVGHAWTAFLWLEAQRRITHDVQDGEPFPHGKTEEGGGLAAGAAASNAVMYRKSSVINGRDALSPVPHTH